MSKKLAGGIIGLAILTGFSFPVRAANSAEDSSAVEEKHQEFEKKVDERLEQMDRQIDELKAKADKMESKAKSEILARITELQKKKSVIKNNLVQLNAAWKDLKSGLDDAMADIQKALDKINDRKKQEAGKEKSTGTEPDKT